jgi:hypothetical protein
MLGDVMLPSHISVVLFLGKQNHEPNGVDFTNDIHSSYHTCEID